MVSLQPVTESNRAEVEALRTSPGQEKFVSRERTGEIVFNYEIVLPLQLR